jgi:hypothetical protein
MLIRLIYASEVAAPLTPAAVRGIVERARAANQRRRITGVLAFDSQSFLQVLEGEREAVSEVFCHIAKDSRHRRVQLLESVAVDERQFASWSMGFAAADAHGRDIFLRHSGDDHFAPSSLTAKSALGLLAGLTTQ